MKRHRALIAAWSVSLLMLALLAGGVSAGLRLNTTRSIPPGVYRVTGELPRLGAYVMACPPPQPVFLVALHGGAPARSLSAVCGGGGPSPPPPPPTQVGATRRQVGRRHS